MRNRKIILERFSEALRFSLIERIKGKCSAGRFSNEFNLRACGTTTITRQTALRWISGKGFPEAGRLYILVQWLDLDLNYIFRNLDTD